MVSRGDRKQDTRLCVAREPQGRRVSSRAKSESRGQRLIRCKSLLCNYLWCPSTWSPEWPQWWWESRCRPAIFAFQRTTSDKAACCPSWHSNSRQWISIDFPARLLWRTLFPAAPLWATELRLWSAWDNMTIAECLGRLHSDKCRRLGW